MIIIKVQGGLGNQLMQYSFGKALSLLYGKDVAYDLSFFDIDTKYTKRPYLLDKFRTEVRIATRNEINKTKYPLGFISEIASKAYRLLNKYFFKKYYVGYNQELLPSLLNKKDLYLEGFWQSYKYYEKNLEILSNEISLINNSSVESFKKEIGFDSKNSTAVHIRRGDFLNKNAGTKALEMDYYKKAVLLFEKKVKDPTYFIFSDDIEWVKNEIGHLFKDSVFVSAYKLSDCEEFIIMKECKHAIIGNSTFSWFSTLLSDKGDKVVFYSHDWKNEYLNKDANICPPHWNKV